MTAHEIRKIPNDSSAIYIKEIPAQLAEIAWQLTILNLTLKAMPIAMPILVQPQKEKI
jgi:hypothetical protein